MMLGQARKNQTEYKKDLNEIKNKDIQQKR